MTLKLELKPPSGDELDFDDARHLCRELIDDLFLSDARLKRRDSLDTGLPVAGSLDDGLKSN